MILKQLLEEKGETITVTKQKLFKSSNFIQTCQYIQSVKYDDRC